MGSKGNHSVRYRQWVETLCPRLGLLFGLAAGVGAPGCGQSPAPTPGQADAGAVLDAPSGGEAAPCPTGNLVCQPLAALPPRLEDTGLLASAGVVRPPGGHGYAPSPELYSDGLSKERFLLLPAGATVDNRNRAIWEFPLGTMFVKTFFDEGGPSGRRPVETRIIRRVPDRFDPFEYAVYRWNAEGSAAELLDIAGNRESNAMVKVGGREFLHGIPSRNQCGDCHEKNALYASPIIGFDEIRLNHKTPSDAARPQIEELAARGIFAAEIPRPAATITDPNPQLLQVKRFVFGNCVHCHHGKMNIVDFRPDVFVANTVNQMPEAPGIAVPEGHRRVVPGDPEKSVVYLQARGTGLPTGLKPMPNVGVKMRELPEFTRELDNLKAWILSLPR